MEGVVLVEAQSGALVFSRSFTDAFDLRHPRSERMNLGALLFALLRFADSSMIPTRTQARSLQQQQQVALPGISAFATADERIVFAHTPSGTLVVALFTAATLDADVASSLVQRLAYNYERSSSVESRSAGVRYHPPRLFRDALSRAIETQVDALLERFAVQLAAIASLSSSSGSHDRRPAFVLFYFADDDDDGLHTTRKALATTTGSSKDDASTRRATATRCLHNKRKTNAVAAYAAPQQFQRVVYVCALADAADAAASSCTDAESPLSDGHSSNSNSLTDAIASVIVPFVKAVMPLFGAGKQQSTQLQQIEWRNVPVAIAALHDSRSRSDIAADARCRATTDVVAWTRSNCVVLYPVPCDRAASTEATESTRLQQLRERKRAVATLCDALEPLVQALVTSRTAVQL